MSKPKKLVGRINTFCSTLKTEIDLNDADAEERKQALKENFKKHIDWYVDRGMEFSLNYIIIEEP